MTWVRLETGFTRHRKILTVGPLGAWLYLEGLCYAGSAGTDGFLPAALLPQLLAPLAACAVIEDARRTRQLRRTMPADQIDWPARLVAAGLWEVVEGGWRIHNYLVRQPDAQYFKALSEKRAESGRIGGMRSGQRRRQRSNEANGQASAAPFASSNEAKSKHDTIRNEEAFVFSGSNDPNPPDLNGHSVAGRGDYLTALERIHAKLAAQRPEGP